MYLVDTCVLSEARRRSPQAVRWLAGVRESTLFVSAITLGEFSKGIERLARKDLVGSASLRQWLAGIHAAYADRVLPVDAAVGVVWGRLMAGRSRPVGGALIAATALVHDKVMVTRNVADFTDAGLRVLDPWAV